MEKLKKPLLLILVLFLSILSIRFLLKPGFFPIHDSTQVARVFEMKEALRSFQFPVRWVSDLGYGYGYPIFNFYNPLPYYFGGLINLLGLSSLTATKIMFVFAIFTSALSMYFLAKEFFGNLGGITSALFYLYAPYHAVQIYVRGAVAELWAYAFLPLIFLFTFKLYKAIKTKKQISKYILLSSLIFTTLILSHNLSVLIWLPSVIIFTIFLSILLTRKVRANFLFLSLSVLLLGLGLSCFFWLPALMEKSFTSVDFMVSQKFNPLEHFVYPDQLWFAFWGYGGSIPGRPDGLSFQIGKPQIIFALLATVFFLKDLFVKKEKNETNKLILFFLLVLLFSIFMMLDLSKAIWQTFFPLLSYLQFPWRFLSLTVFASSFLVGSIFLGLPKKKNFKHFSFVVILIVLIFVNYRYFQPLYTGPAQDSDFLADFKLKWETSLVSDEYLPQDFPRPQSFEDLPKSKFYTLKEAKLTLESEKTHHYNLEMESSQDNFLIANLAYFPGWKATIDNQETAIIKDRGVITLPISPGKHQVSLTFKNTPVRTLANFISAFSLLLLISLTLIRLKRNS